MGIMLESSSKRLSERGGPHFGSPDKNPKRRLEALRNAGIKKIPFTTGILIGIGETRLERIQSLLDIRELHSKYGHIQEVIIQNFRPKPDTKMSDYEAPLVEDLLWTIAVARLIFGSCCLSMIISILFFIRECPAAAITGIPPCFSIS